MAKGVSIAKKSGGAEREEAAEGDEKVGEATAGLPFPLKRLGLRLQGHRVTEEVFAIDRLDGDAGLRPIDQSRCDIPAYRAPIAVRIAALGSSPGSA